MQQSVYLFAPQRLESGFVHVLLLLFWARSISALHVKGLHSRQPLLLIPAAAQLWRLPLLTLLNNYYSRRICHHSLAQLHNFVSWQVKTSMRDDLPIKACVPLKNQTPLLRTVLHPMLHPGTENTNCMPGRPCCWSALGQSFATVVTES